MRVLRDYECDRCGRVREEFGEVTTVLACGCLFKGRMRHVYLKAPGAGKLGPEGSDTSIAAMRRSFRERFVRKEIDDVRHKHGKVFDESLASAAVKRIREGKA